MSESYNPIHRTSDRLHESLTRTLGLPETEIGPETEIEALIPIAIRRTTWRRMREDGLDVRGLELPQDFYACLFAATLISAAGLAVFLWTWFGLLFVIPIGLIAYWLSRPWSVRFPVGLRSVGELALFITRFGEHKDSGYHWKSDEIALKVRMIFAESLGLPLARVQRENRMVEIEKW